MTATLPGSTPGVSILAVMNVLMRRRRFLLGSIAVGGILGLLLAFARPVQFTASAAFMPQASSGGLSGGVSGIAAQLGVAIPLGEPNESPAFYAILLTSHQLLTEIAREEFPFPPGHEGELGTLGNYWDLSGRTEVERTETAVHRLRDHMRVVVDRRAGIVTAQVTDRSSMISALIVDRLLEGVNRFNLERRQTHARAEREFLAVRRDTSLAELQEAEDSLEQFLTRNRDFRSSPTLQFQHDRLSRTVTMRQTLYTSLVQAFEQARIEEVRNTPVITVIEEAEPPVKPDSRRVVAFLVLGGFLGTLFGLGSVGISEWVAHARENEGETFKELLGYWGQVKLRSRWIARRAGKPRG